MSVKEFKVPAVETIESIRARLPSFARDISLNLSAVMLKHPGTGLSQKQILGVALTTAFALRSNLLVHAIIGEAQDLLLEVDIEAAKIAATMETMNSVYYHFTEQISDDEFKIMPTRLRVNTSRNSGVLKIDYTLYAFAVHVALGLSDDYETEVCEILGAGITKIGIQQVVKIVSVITATDCALSI